MENPQLSSQHNQLLRQPNHDENLEVTDIKFYLRKRYFVTSLVFLSWNLLYFMRVNLSISIVDMTSNKSVTIGNETFIKDPEFNWTSQEKGLLLSAFSLGYMAAPLGALAAIKYGSVLTYGVLTTMTGLLTIATPHLMSWNITVYLIARILEGIFEGFAISAVVEVLRIWSTPAERTRVYSTVPAGLVMGSMIGYPICGTIIYLLNWRAVFYITGGASLLWSLIWFALVRSCPQKDTLMSSAERNYLNQVNKCISSQNTIKYPWKEIFKSKPVWAYWNDRFVDAWSSTFLVYCLPLYIKDVHDVNIKDIGLISAIPHFCGVVGVVGGSIVADYLRSRKILSISNVHKVYLSFAQIVAIILLITAALWRNFVANIIIFSLFRMCFNITDVSYEVLPADIGGPYGSVIFGFGVTLYGVGAFLSPLVLGLIVTNRSTSEWSIFFVTLSLFNLWASIIFWIFGSGDLQPWAIPAEDNTNGYSECGRSDSVDGHQNRNNFKERRA